MERGNQYIQLVKVLYCKLPNNGKQLPAFPLYLFIYLFKVLCCLQHCTGHITTGSWKGRGNQYIQLVKVLYCQLPNNGKQLSHLWSGR